MHTPSDNYTLLLASKSPRRRELIGKLGFPVRCIDIVADERLHDHVASNEVAQHIAQLKANAYTAPLQPNEILITADTVVVLDNKVLGKPASRDEARAMLQMLSARTHLVYTGVCLRTQHRQQQFTEMSKVQFKKLDKITIEYYLDQNSYSDKAGSYGIQDWIGYVAVERIEGCYYNVMGLPMAHLYQAITELL
ncbi:MAG: septum formation protein Maf [Bacteroidales bacterium]|nr:septum formation protein Maf [Bacteroidales bacterium]